MGADAAFAYRSDAADPRQACPASQPTGADQQWRGQQQDNATTAPAQALMDCYDG